MDKRNVFSITLWIGLFLLLITLCFAACNFFIINSEVEISINETVDILDSINTKLNSKQDSVNIQKDITDGINTISTSLGEIKDLKKGIFDSNVITFLVSFVLVFLGGILLGIENKANRRIKESDNILNTCDIEQKTMDLYTQVFMLKLLISNLRIEKSKGSANNNAINVLVNEIFVIIEDLLNVFDKKYFKITENKKIFLIRTCNQMIHPWKSETAGNSPSIEKIIQKMETLKTKISELEIIKLNK